MAELLIPGYRIVKLLGEGGMGSVYLAEHEVMGKLRAIKVLQAQWSQDPLQVKRFITEARIASALEHRNIITIHDCGQLANAQWFIVMDFLKGCDLTAHWEQSGRVLDEPETLRYMVQIANALTEAHAHNVVHRDLKPDNVFLTDRDGDGRRVVLLDFGIAKLQDNTLSMPLTRSGQAFGTPYYMAPEQMEDASSVDSRADVYALAVIAYQLRTGRLPFDGPSVQAIYHSQRTNKVPPDPRHYNAAITAEWADVIMRGLRLAPSERIQTPAELAIELARVTPQVGALPDGMSILGTYAKELRTLADHPDAINPSTVVPGRSGETAPSRTRVLAESPRSSAPTQTPQAAAITVEPAARRSRGALVFAGAALIVVVAGATLFAFTHGGQPATHGETSSGGAPTSPNVDAASPAATMPADAAELDRTTDAAITVDAHDAHDAPTLPVDAGAPIDARPHHHSATHPEPTNRAGSGSGSGAIGSGSDFDPDDVGGH